MRFYEVRVESNPHHLDVPPVTTVRGRVGRLHSAVRDHLHHLLATDDVQLVLREREGGATARAVIGARAGRGGAQLALTLTALPSVSQPINEAS